MTWRAVTRWALIAALAAWLVVEVVALTNQERGDTITAVVRDAVRKWPIIAVGIGILIGHLFWSTPD